MSAADPWASPIARIQADLDVATPGVTLRRRGEVFRLDDCGEWFEADLPDPSGDAEADTHALLCRLRQGDFVLPRCPVHPDRPHSSVPKLTRELGAAWACEIDGRAVVTVGGLAQVPPPPRLRDPHPD